MGSRVFDVPGTRVAVIDVVDVLPKVAGQKRLGTMGDRAVPAVCRNHFEAAFGFLHQPGPSAAEMRGGRVGEFLLERRDGAKSLPLMASASLPPGRRRRAASCSSSRSSD